MSSPSKAPELTRATPLDVAEDAFAMRDAAITDLHALGGRSWTDFNAHDPGITFLETLCYGLAELGYLAGSDIADLLTKNDGVLDYQALGLFLPEAIFGSSPLSELDYRKVILDEVPNLENVWFGPAQGTLGRLGVRAVNFLLRPGRCSVVSASDAIADCLRRHRALGDSFLQPLQNLPMRLWIVAEVDESPDITTEVLLDNLSQAIDFVLTPPITFSTEDADTVATSAPACGPRLKHGTLSDGALWGPILEVEAVRRVESVVFSVVHDCGAQLRKLSVFFEAAVAGPRVYRLNGPKSLVTVHSALPSLSSSYPLSSQALHPSTAAADFLDPQEERTVAPPGGQFLDAQHYMSIQRDIPSIYGLDGHDLQRPSRVDAALPLQLKSYLAVYDHVLAGGHQQIGCLGRVLGPVADDAETWTQPIYDTPGIVPLLEGFADARGTSLEQEAARRAYEEDAHNPYRLALQNIADQWVGNGQGRRDVLLHLLARFGYDLPPLADPSFETNAQIAAWLRAIPEFSYARGKAAEHGPDSAASLSAPEKLAGIVLALPEPEPASWGAPLSVIPSTSGAHAYEGRAYFLLEHVSLLDTSSVADAPDRAGVGCSAETLDSARGGLRVPVSFFTLALSHMLTNWTARALTPQFVRYTQGVLAPLMPAHLSSEWHWLSAAQMATFSALYSQWASDGYQGANAGAHARCCAEHLVVDTSSPAGQIVSFILVLGAQAQAS